MNRRKHILTRKISIYYINKKKTNVNLTQKYQIKITQNKKFDIKKLNYRKNFFYIRGSLMFIMAITQKNYFYFIDTDK